MKQRVKSAVKKRFYKTKWWKGKVMRAMSNHRHRLIPKWKRVKQAAWKNHCIDSKTQSKTISNILK
jgi:ribosomal protein L35